MTLTAPLHRIARRTGTAVIWLAIVLAALLISITAVIPVVRGYVPITITSESMAPTIMPGTLIFAELIEDGTEAELGDVVTFMPEAGNDRLLYTHRLIGKTMSGGGMMIQTRGDANPAPDALLPAEAVRAKLVELQVGSLKIPYAVPKIGAAYLWLTKAKTESGIQEWIPAIGVGTILAGGLYLAAGFLPKRRRDLLSKARAKRRGKLDDDHADRPPQTANLKADLAADLPEQLAAGR